MEDVEGQVTRYIICILYILIWEKEKKKKIRNKKNKPACKSS